MLARMTAGQLTEWQAFFELEPFGDGRADLRAGVVAAAVANFAFGRAKDAKGFKPSDFFENLRPPTKVMTGADLSEQAENLTRSMGGRVQTRAEAAARRKAEAEKKARIAEAKAKQAETVRLAAEEREAKKASRKASQKGRKATQSGGTRGEN